MNGKNNTGIKKRGWQTKPPLGRVKRLALSPKSKHARVRTMTRQARFPRRGSILKMTVKRGDIFYADLSPVIGSEQGGLRPVLIVQNDVGNKYSPTVIAAAITSRLGKNRLPTHIDITRSDTAGADVFGLAKDSVILLEQIRTLDKRRLKEKMGHLDDRLMKQVNDAITVSFGLAENVLSAYPVQTARTPSSGETDLLRRRTVYQSDKTGIAASAEYGLSSGSAFSSGQEEVTSAFAASSGGIIRNTSGDVERSDGKGPSDPGADIGTDKVAISADVKDVKKAVSV